MIHAIPRLGICDHDDAATLLSNGMITLQGAKIHGDMVAADDGKVVLQANSLVTGDVVYGNTLSNSGTVQGSTYHHQTTPFVAPIPGACGSLYQGADDLDHRRLHL